MRRILVSSFTQDVLEAFQHLLEAEGYEVVPFLSLALHITTVKQINPEVILLAYVLDREGNLGWQILTMLRLDPAISTIPIIIITNAEEEMYQQEDHLRQQKIYVLYKPFDIHILLNTMKQVLSTSHS